MKTNMKITLKSDLCASSGFAFAGIIDTDVSYDRYGFPYISGKRLKGCIREAAEYIGISEDEILKIFGKRASSEYEESGGISISNAYPKTCPRENPFIDGLYSDPGYRKYFNTENVLNIFTSVQPHTKINEDGTAEKNTLRFIRKINHFDPVNKEEMVFEAEMELPDKIFKGTGSEMFKLLDNAVKATRNIGINRNRGLGSVKIEMIPIDDSSFDQDCTVTGDRKRPVVFRRPYSKDAELVRIRYAITNTAPIMIGSEKDTVSLDYINGGSVLGAFASLYLSKDGNTPESQEFRDLFLSGKTVFSNLYYAHVIPAPGKEYPDIIRYCPVPKYINRLKKSDTLVNVYEYNDAYRRKLLNEEDNYYGNLPKELEGKFIAEVNGKYDINEVKKEIIYHHTKKNKEQLFFFDAISAGQQFAGEIIVEGKYAETILGILAGGKLRFGKSRSVQYGTCKVDICIAEEYSPEKTASLIANSKVRINLLSDAVFMDEDGNYITDYDKIWDYIREKIGADYDNPNESHVKTKIVTGYSGKWNLHRPEIPVISAGSSFAFYSEEEMKLPERLGIRINEGFGEYSFVVDNGSEYWLEEEKVDTAGGITPWLVSEDSRLGSIYRKILLNRIGENIRNKVFDDKINISAASLGRLALMAVEADNTARKNGADDYSAAFEAFKAFVDRVYSIKRREVREESIRYLERILGYFPILQEDSKTRIFEKVSDSDVKVDSIVRYFVTDKETGNVYEEYARLLEVSSEEDVKKTIFSKWMELVHEALQFQKYSMKGER